MYLFLNPNPCLRDNASQGQLLNPFHNQPCLTGLKFMRVKGFEGVEDMNDKERMWPFVIKFDTPFPICGLVLVCSVIETYENPEVCAVAITFKNQVNTY